MLYAPFHFFQSQELAENVHLLQSRVPTHPLLRGSVCVDFAGKLVTTDEHVLRSKNYLYNSILVTSMDRPNNVTPSRRVAILNIEFNYIEY